MIWPLPLAPFEQYMLTDDRPSCPMTFFVRLRCSGTVFPQAFEAAVGSAVARHPLLSAIVRRTKRNKLVWIAVNRLPAIHWAPLDDSETIPSIDLLHEPGLRLWVDQREGYVELLAQFHHACCDGLGAVQFLEDLLIGYAQPGETSPERVLEKERLHDRGRFGMTAWRFLQLLPRQLVGLLGVRQFFAHAPVPLVPSIIRPSRKGEHSVRLSFINRGLTPNESAALRQVARRHGVTVNDLLIRDWFRAVTAWRAEHFASGDRDWLRLTVPMNLRAEADRRMPAANLVSMVFLDRNPCDCVNPGRLLAGIHREMQRIKRCQLGLTFLYALRIAQALGGMRRMVRTDRCSASGVLTNMGTLFKDVPLPTREGRLVAGNLVLEEIAVLAPLRPYTDAAFSVLSYADQLQVGVHYAPYILQPAWAEELIETFVTCLRNSINSAEQTTSLALSEASL